MGIGMGCELDPANPWQCKAGSSRAPTPWAWDFNPIMVDRPVVFGGEAYVPPSACCHPNLTCSMLSPDNCASLGGTLHSGATCTTPSPCCHTPPADFDGDGDVDMNDFAVLQRCLNLGGGTLGVGCGCFDTNSNGIIDSTDVEKFIKCASGEGVPWVACSP